VLPLLLIHGGLWESMDAHRFWVRPGIAADLSERGHPVIAPDRPRMAESWAAEVDDLLRSLPDGRVVVVAGSNGCSVAARLAADHPDRIAGLLLAWPATAGDPAVDASVGSRLHRLGPTTAVVDGLLAGGTLRGVTDAELAGLTGPVGVVGARPDNQVHQRRTVDALLALVPKAVELPSCPEPPRPEFAGHRTALVTAVARFAENAAAAR
jgi:Ni,Fe-hydrogenase III small subunit